MKVLTLILASVVLASGACSSAESEPTKDQGLIAMEAWRASQSAQECPDVPQDKSALDLVRSTQEAGDSGHVYGEDDPYDRVTPILDHLWSRPNPRGDGVIITATRNGDGNDNTAIQSRSRAVWLVLNDKIYPLNVEASQAYGLLSSGLPSDIAGQSGLPQHGINTERDLGISDRIFFRWSGPEDPLPACT